MHLSAKQDNPQRALTRLSIAPANIGDMTHTARIKIAAAVVMLFFAALSTAGVLSHTPAPSTG